MNWAWQIWWGGEGGMRVGGIGDFWGMGRCDGRAAEKEVQFSRCSTCNSCTRRRWLFESTSRQRTGHQMASNGPLCCCLLRLLVILHCNPLAHTGASAAALAASSDQMWPGLALEALPRRNPESLHSDALCSWPADARTGLLGPMAACQCAQTPMRAPCRYSA